MYGLVHRAATADGADKSGLTALTWPVVANFAVESWPQGGTIYITIFLLGIVGITAWHLIAARRAAKRAEVAA